MNCYNCGKKVSNDSRIEKETTGNEVLKNIPEHVPAKCFYVGVQDSFKQNLITVPACYTCNNGFSGFDDELRNILGIANDSMTEGEELTAKSVRAVLKKSNWTDKIRTDADGKVFAVSFNRQHVYNIYEKNFKALFYHEYKTTSENFNPAILFDGFGMNPNVIKAFKNDLHALQQHVGFLHNLLVQNATPKVSGHRDIFEYAMLPVTGRNGYMKPETDVTNASAILMMQIYHQTIRPIIIAGNIKMKVN